MCIKREEWLRQVQKHWDDTADSEWYKSLRTSTKIQNIMRSPESVFHPKVYELIQKYMPVLSGKKVLLPSSGDNYAAFAFSLLGAKVTSADISEKQLENAKVIAEQLELDIHPFTRPFTCEAWKEPKILKRYEDIVPDCHWRVQDLLNAMIAAKLNIKQIEELQAIDASVWFSYEELLQQSDTDLKKINDWKYNPMAALPSWISIVSQK